VHGWRWCGGLEEEYPILVKESQTHYNMPRDGKMGLAIDELK
jgi:hypothetical protein